MSLPTDISDLSDYKYGVSVLSTRIRLKKQKYLKCSWLELRIRARKRPRTPI